MATAGVILSIGSKFGPGGLASLQAGIQMMGQLASAIKGAFDEAWKYGEMMRRLDVDISLADQATKGMIDTTELVRGAMKFQAAQMEITPKQLRDIAVAAENLSDKLGTDATSEFIKLTDSITKASTRGLRPLGIDLEETEDLLKAQAEALQKVTALGAEQTSEYDNMGDRLYSLNNSWGTFMNTLLTAQGEVPAVTNVLDSLIKKLNEMTSGLADFITSEDSMEKTLKYANLTLADYRTHLNLAEEGLETLGVSARSSEEEIAKATDAIVKHMTKVIEVVKDIPVFGDAIAGYAASKIAEAEQAKRDIEKTAIIHENVALAAKMREVDDELKATIADTDAMLAKAKQIEIETAKVTAETEKKTGGGGRRSGGKKKKSAEEDTDAALTKELAAIDAEWERSGGAVNDLLSRRWDLLDGGTERIVLSNEALASQVELENILAGYESDAGVREQEVWAAELEQQADEEAYQQRKAEWLAVNSETREEMWARELEIDQERWETEQAYDDWLREQDEYTYGRKVSLAEQWLGIDQQSIDQSNANWKLGVQTKIAMLGSLVSGWSGLMDKENKKQFKAWQALAITETVISGLVGSIEAFKALAGIPYVGPILGAVAAASVLAQTAVTVAKIKKTKYKGGGSSASAGGGFNVNTGSSGGGSPPEQQQQSNKIEITNIVQLDGEKVYENVKTHNDGALRAGRGDAFSKAS